MKLRKITSSGVIGYIIDPYGAVLADNQGNCVVFVDEVCRYLLSAKKRDTNLLVSA